jgi:hypothetical protein
LADRDAQAARHYPLERERRGAGDLRRTGPIVTSHASTPKLAPSCNSVPNATTPQGSQGHKRSAIRQHETQGGSRGKRSQRKTKDEEQGEDAWESPKEKLHQFHLSNDGIALPMPSGPGLSVRGGLGASWYRCFSHQAPSSPLPFRQCLQRGREEAVLAARLRSSPSSVLGRQRPAFAQTLPVFF